MNILDWFVLSTLALSALVGLLRGAAYEIIALAGWVAAFVLARRFGPWLAQTWLQGIDAPGLRLGAGWALCFIVVLLGSGVLATLARFVLRSTGLGLLDRSMGAAFGLVRGGGVIVAAVLLARYTQLPASSLWNASLLVPPAATLAAEVSPLLPLAAPGA